MEGSRIARPLICPTLGTRSVVLAAMAVTGLLSSVSSGPLLTRANLDRAIKLGTQYLLSNQLPDGRFVYIYDLNKKRPSLSSNQVRQAGALWGLSLLHLDSPTEVTRSAVLKGLQYFRTHAERTEQGGSYLVVPGEKAGRTGTMALVTLALTDFVRAEMGGAALSQATREQLSMDLQSYLEFLMTLRRLGGHFAEQYRYDNGTGVGGPSPYFDGESLLALARASKYIPNLGDYKSAILESAASMHRRHVQEALQIHPDSDQTKGFFQWGILSFYELFDSGWEDTEVYGQRAIDMAHWMIDVHKTLERTKNTAYAIEGIATACEIARRLGDSTAQAKFTAVVEQALTKLTSWQAGHPLQNEFLASFSELGLGLGGVMNSKEDPAIRIDVVQHQMHALLLARRFVYRD